MAKRLRPVPLKHGVCRPCTTVANYRSHDDPSPVQCTQPQRGDRAQAPNIMQDACIYSAVRAKVAEPEFVIRHIRPASTTHNWPVHIRLSSDASHSTMRVT